MIGAMAAFAVGVSTVPDCSSSLDNAKRTTCLEQRLAAADGAINDSYLALRRRLTPDDQLRLRDEQRAWIAERDRVCGLAKASGEGSAWRHALSADYAKAACVIRVTAERQAELSERLTRIASGGPPPLTVPRPAPPSFPLDLRHLPGRFTADFDLSGQTPRASGKWYFEAVLDIPKLGPHDQQPIFVGVRSTTTLFQVLRAAPIKCNCEDRLINLGFAVDLDAGKIYMRDNGAWQKGGPGSAGGSDLKLGQWYLATMYRDVDLTPLVKSGVVDLNLGQKPFAYAVPDGYQAIDPEGPIPFVGAVRPF